jgi:hypothetical protein
MNARHTSWACAAAVAAALALTACLYARPDMAVLLAEQLWACFGV